MSQYNLKVLTQDMVIGLDIFLQGLLARNEALGRNLLNSIEKHEEAPEPKSTEHEECSKL